MKKIICLLLSAMLLISMPISTAAALPDSSIQPLWDNMSTASIIVGFSGTTGTASVSVSRIAGVTTKMEGTLTVYEIDGDNLIYVDSKYMSSTRSLAFSLSFDATSGTEYIAIAEVIAHSATSSETETFSDTGTCP